MGVKTHYADSAERTACGRVTVDVKSSLDVAEVSCARCQYALGSAPSVPPAPASTPAEAESVTMELVLNGDILMWLRALRVTIQDSPVMRELGFEVDLHRAVRVALARGLEHVREYGYLSPIAGMVAAAVPAANVVQMPQRAASSMKTYNVPEGTPVDADGNMIPPQGWGRLGSTEIIAHGSAHEYYIGADWLRFFRYVAGGTEQFYWCPHMIGQDMAPYDQYMQEEDVSGYGVIHVFARVIPERTVISHTGGSG